MNDKGVEILIVEDSPTQAEQLKYLLEERGHSVNIATNGKQAIDKLREYRPALVISDIVMPEMDGYTLCREIKSDKDLKWIPVILVTALSDPHDIIKGLEAGADNFIMKPYAEKYLLKIIQQILINQEFQQEKPMQMGMEIFFRDKKYFITADRLQILTLLLSTYETAVEKNLDLIETQNELKKLNEELEEKVKDRTSALVEEVAERKRTEIKLLRVNRALKTLSSCNEVLVRTRDESELLKNICQNLIDIGGYRLAWVGFAEQDKAKTVRPVAQAGFEEGYLENAKITWADTERGQSPVGTAIRTGTLDIARDFRIDPRLKPWRDEALKRGYVSNIGLPLKANLHPFGVLAIYASEPDAFDDDEVKLLTELANDLAYGIITLRTRAERKRVEEALRESEQRFKAIFDNAADGILLVDVVNKKFHSGNSMICKMLSYSEEEIKNMGIMDIHPEKDLAYVIEQFKKQAGGEITLAKDIPVKRKDGSVFYADINSFPITLAGKTYLVGIFRDTTERKQAEEALRHSENKYRVLIENLPQKIFLKDRNSVYVSCNENYARDLKIRPDEITGKTDYDFYPKELAEKYRADDQKIMEVGNIEAVDEKYFLNAHEVWVHTVKTPVKDEKGNIVGILGIFWDISEHKKMEDELKNRVKELEDFYNMSVGRELKMIELKNEIESLKAELSKYKKDI
jgi:PAS domain S-box-containing protein